MAKRVRVNHDANGGMSRHDKLPLYLQWADQEPTEKPVDEHGVQFSMLVKQKVIDSSWVAGVLDYLKQNYQSQQFFLVTATPQKEIENIVARLNKAHYFRQVMGAPAKKVT